MSFISSLVINYFFNVNSEEPLILFPIITWIIILVSGSVRTLRSSGASSPVRSCSTSTTACDRRLSRPLAASKGRSTKTDNQLKQSWTVAPANALKQTQRKSLCLAKSPFNYTVYTAHTHSCTFQTPLSS